MAHPLDPLSAAEIEAAAAIARDAGLLTDAALVARISVHEPDKREQSSTRRADITIVPGPEATVVEAVVDLGTRAVVSAAEHPDCRPALLFEESLLAIGALHDDDRFKAALARRGITDLAKVQIDPWPAGTFGIAHEQQRRITRCLCYYREDPNDNGYARPIEGLLVIVDMARAEVLEVIDERVVPLPPERGSYALTDNEPARGDLKPIEITQSAGVGFTIDGNTLTWGKWAVHVSMDPYEGIVLRDVAYDGRSIIHRASVSEMVVPYGDPNAMHGWKNAFDAGDWGLGRMAQPLALGCDCLGEIRYLDAIFSGEHGNPYTVTNAICLHEEDFGILWKHADLHTGNVEVRRQRRMVISSIATVGNYE
jgi:primary-amine oxidase